MPAARHLLTHFTDLIDLAAERTGGRALLASDEFFAEKENLLKPGRGVFVEGRYTDRGKWMDGWESRRKRTPGNDWCIIRLGLPGIVRGVTVDTNHFKGNAPEAVSIDACDAPRDETPEALARRSDWRTLVPRTRIEPHLENKIEVNDPARCTHLRLNIFPDGGVARFRAFGEVVPDWTSILARNNAVDLAAVEHGGQPMGCSDAFFSEPRNLIMPGRSECMGDGWETRRRRGPGYDWVVIRLGRRGVIERILLDTNHFKGNYPDTCDIEVCDAPGATEEHLRPGATNGPSWRTLLPRTKLAAHEERIFERELLDKNPVTHLRLNIHPDGGVSRLRVFGRPVAGADR
ncbi:MAG: allantoicase [Phycisphaerae bacterium]|nr:allantoicase [Phycisphaerae bacterium]